MMGAASRAKGRRAQTEGSKLLVDAGFTCVDTSAGNAVEDVFALDPHGDPWAVEVTADGSISLAAKWRQAAAQAAARGVAVRPLLLWKIAGGGWWLVVAEPPRRRPSNELELEPPASMAHRTYCRTLARLRPHPGTAMPVFVDGELLVAPAELALSRWWRP